MYKLLILLALLTFCNAQQKNGIFNEQSAEQFKLSSKLKEISGIALTKDGRLLGHDDERSVIYELDKESGTIVKTFYFGMLVKKADFEDIEIVGDDIYIVTSNGIIYKIKEGANGQRVKFEAFATGLGKSNNVEGLGYDPRTHHLLLALKGSAGKKFKSHLKAIYRFNLNSNKLEKLPHIFIDQEEIEELTHKDNFSPSGIAYNPATDSYFTISAKGNLIIELNRAGDILRVQRLNSKRHWQPEGIAIDRDGTLYISDEGRKNGQLTRYKLHK